VPATPAQPVHASDYTAVTETWGLAATPEQLSMMYSRYRFAAELAGGGSVLEVGCGAGMGLRYLAERSSLAVGGDFTANLLKNARQHVSTAPLVRLDAQALPFRDAQFEVVLLLEMVYYLSDLELALVEARRVLRPNGAVFITVPNPNRPDFNPSPQSVSYPNAVDLGQILKRARFAPEVFGNFPVADESGRDRLLHPVRQLAVRFHLIPRSMRMKSLVKRALYGDSRVGAVRDELAPYRPPTRLEGDQPVATYKVLYAVGRL